MPVVGFLGGMFGPWELGIILVIVLILFGAGRLPQVLESFGQGIKAFRNAQKDDPLDLGQGELTDASLSDAEEVAAKVAERSA